MAARDADTERPQLRVESYVANRLPARIALRAAVANEVSMSAGDLFERYVAMHELGAGGMARVVLAHDRLLDRRVALKLLRTSEPELMLRLLNEARITARCRHDNIVDIYE